MDIKTNSEALILIRQLFDPSVKTEVRLATKSRKPAAAAAPSVLPLPRSAPEEQGVPSSHIAAFLDELRNDGTLDMHRVMILRGGRVLADAAFGAYDKSLWHITHSECKSITALAVGFLIDDGKLSLSDRLIDILGEYSNVLTQFSHRSLTLRHLLTMTSGISFNEAGSVTEKDWAKCFFESGIFSEPGKKFAYNSMNTYMLSLVVKKVSGQGLVDFLRLRLFEPLGITDVFWETCPLGVEKGGWGLYIHPEDIAKIGQLVLQKGEWEGRRLISREWIEQAAAYQVAAPKSCGDFNYGYQLWVGRDTPTFLFNGMFGQNVLGNFKNGILVVCNAGNNELFQQSSFYRLVKKYFAGSFSDSPLPRDHAARRGLERVIRDCAVPEFRSSAPDWAVPLRRRPLAPVRLCENLSGRVFRSDTPNAVSVGLYPLYAQAIQNNYSSGLERVRFEYTGGSFFIVLDEADESHRLPVGFAAPEYAELSFHGEPQRVAVFGRFTEDENDSPVLKLRVSFLEISSSRFIKIYFTQGRIRLKFSESPGTGYLFAALETVKSKSNPIVEAIVSKAGSRFLRSSIEQTFEPEVGAHEQDGGGAL